MARLIVLNGMPAVGKSTLARRYADEHPLTLVAELDAVRRRLGGWREQFAISGERARGITLAMARDHLAAGYDVVLPQYLGNPRFLVEAEQVATGAGAAFAEFVLTDNRDSLVRRFNERTRAAARPEHVDAGRVIAELGGDDVLFAMCDRLLLVVSARPHSHLIACPQGAGDDAYRQLREHLDA